MSEERQWILHVDMDAFFASVEILDNPELKGLPVAVGGTSPRGVISAASYEIRKYGVHSAMPAVTARRLCPHGVYLPGRMSRYKEASRQVMAVLRDFSPVVEQASVDEAFLDATGLERLFGPIEELCATLKARVREATGLTCSVGAAPVRFLAKIASDRDKPDGLFILRPGEVEEFLKTLPVNDIPGVGPKAGKVLRDLGVRFAADMLRHSEAFWVERLGKWGRGLYARAQGLDSSPVTPHSPAKSSSAENTFDRDTMDRDELTRWLLKQSERVGEDLRKHGLAGRTVTLKAKYADFRQVTRSRTLDEPVCDTRTIFETARALLDGLGPKRPLRLIGVGVSNFEAGPGQVQLSLLDPEGRAGKGKDGNRAAVDKAVDAVRGRFGRQALVRGELLDKPDSGQETWGETRDKTRDKSGDKPSGRFGKA